MRKWMIMTIGAVFIAAIPLSSRAALEVEFRYDFDDPTAVENPGVGFFSDPLRREVLEAAADLIVGRLNDQLAEIDDEWLAIGNSPVDGSQFAELDLRVPENKIIIYAAGTETFGKGSSILAQSFVGKSIPNPFTVDDDLVRARGQSGALDTVPTDFGPWGGSIGFNNFSNWGFATPDENPTPGAFDFLSLAMHEIAHVLGIGNAPSWDELISDRQFFGQASMDLFGGSVPLHDDGINGKSNHFAASGIQPPPAMAPTFASGEREFFTDLDWAALTDIGWEVSQLAIARLADGSQPFVTGVVLDRDTETATLSGTLDIRLIDQLVPTFGELFPVVTANTRNGEFDQINGVLSEGGDFALAPMYDHQGSIGLTLVTALPGDANLDGEVNEDDLSIFFANNGGNGDWSQANLDGDSDIDLHDLEIIFQNLGRKVVMQDFNSALSAVPVPATAAILGLGMLVFTRRRSISGP